MATTRLFWTGAFLGFAVLLLVVALYRGILQETRYARRDELQPVIQVIDEKATEATLAAKAAADKATMLLRHHQKEVDIRSREMVFLNLQAELRQWRRTMRLRNDPATRQYELDQLRELEALVRRAELAYQADVAELARLHGP